MLGHLWFQFQCLQIWLNSNKDIKNSHGIVISDNYSQLFTHEVALVARPDHSQASKDATPEFFGSIDDFTISSFGAAQRVEHYEIAGYGTARRVGKNEIAGLLQHAQ